MQVGLQSLRLGAAMYFVPFFFVLNPALILRGSAGEILVVVGTAVVGVALIASAREGYVVGLGAIARNATGFVSRLLLFAGGLMMARRSGGELELSHVQLSLGRLLLAIAGARPQPLSPSPVYRSHAPEFRAAPGSERAWVMYPSV